MNASSEPEENSHNSPTNNPGLAVLGVDTGGTFTDLVCYYPNGDTFIHKVLSTPKAPEQAILTGIAELGLNPQNLLSIVHGSTVATNALLERKGVKTAYLTNRGFRDVLLIGRQARRELYNLTPERFNLPVLRELCVETGGRLSAQGEVLEPLTDADKQQLLKQLATLQPEAVAINLLFSYIDDRYERELEALLKSRFFVSRSSAVLAEYGEYERGIVTWINAWLGPRVQSYLQRLEQAVHPTPLSIMQSSGGTIDGRVAGDFSVNLLLSGPAGGLIGAQAVARCSGKAQIMTVDMGGTSTDVALINNAIKLTTRGEIDGFPVAVPMVDMHTIGAGGGSLAYLDAGGLLQVGPESAGADPGPACYGRGGQQPTVTDANLVLGRIVPNAFLGGAMQLDVAAARAALQTIADPLGISLVAAAEGVVRLANEHMTAALRVISVQRGINPRDYTLVPFGGAGGLHVCALAEALGMHSVLIPVHAGVLSALGMVVAPHARQASRTLTRVLAEIDFADLQQQLRDIETELRKQLQAEVPESMELHSHWSLDLRYTGQSFFINCPWQQTLATITQAFHQAHQDLYGHRLDEAIELVNLRVEVSSVARDLQLSTQSMQKALESYTLPVPVTTEDLPAYWRSELSVGETITGPCLILEPIATSYIAPGWRGSLDAAGNLLCTLVEHTG